MRYADKEVIKCMCGRLFHNPCYHMEQMADPEYATSQKVYPQATRDQRECAISGMCYTCQKEIFGTPVEIPSDHYLTQDEIENYKG